MIRSCPAVVIPVSCDLNQILDLQLKNLPQHISKEEATAQGFVTVHHNFDLLKQMNSPYPHIIAKINDEIIGYALVMLKKFENDIPILVSMFKQINGIRYKGQKLEHARFFIMGQVCIEKRFRGEGVFSGLYEKMKKQMSNNFDYVITEVSKRNPRSLRAHSKAGFQTINEYVSETGEHWEIILLELNNDAGN